MTFVATGVGSASTVVTRAVACRLYSAGLDRTNVGKISVRKMVDDVMKPMMGDGRDTRKFKFEDSIVELKSRAKLFQKDGEGLEDMGKSK